MFSLAKAASMAERHMEHLHELELLGREERNGNQSKEISS
jgi:hypothetical protein